MKILPPISIEARRFLPSRWDALAALLLFGFIVLFADASRHVVEPLTTLKTVPLSLSPWALPGYALRTALRMLIAMGFSLLFTFRICHLGGQERTRRELADPPAGHPPIGAHPGVHFGDGRLLHVAGAGARSRRRIRRDLRDLHQPGVEHGVQLLSKPAHRPDRADRAAQFPLDAVDALLAARSAVRHAAPDLEHDDVHVRRLVFRRGGVGVHRGQHIDRVAGGRILYRARNCA